MLPCWPSACLSIQPLRPESQLPQRSPHSFFCPRFLGQPPVSLRQSVLLLYNPAFPLSSLRLVTPLNADLWPVAHGRCHGVSRAVTVVIRDTDEKGGVQVLPPQSPTLPPSHHFWWTAKRMRLRGCGKRLSSGLGAGPRSEMGHCPSLEVVRGSGWGWAERRASPLNCPNGILCGPRRQLSKVTAQGQDWAGRGQRGERGGISQYRVTFTLVI